MKKVYVAAIFVLGLICGIIVNNTVLPAMAEVAEMDHKMLRSDREFRKAVEYIVEDCRINEEGKIRC